MFRIIREASDRVIANLVRFKDGYNVYLTLNISNGNLFGLESSDRLDLKNYEVARIFDDTYSEVVPRLPDQYEQCTFNDSSFTSTTLSPVESSLVRTQISVVVVAIVVSSIAFVALYFVFLAASRRKRTMPQSATSSQAQLLAYNEFEQVYSRIIGDKTEFDLTFQLLTTSHECIQKNAMLHEGFFGPVFRGVLKTKGENKQVLIETLTDQAENAQKHFFFQCYLHHLLCRHPNILGLCGILVADTDTIRVMDIPFHATLQDHVKFFRPSLFEKVKVLEQVASGLAYLEAVSIVHRALCAENIYVGKSLEFVKIAGFVEARDVYLDQTYIASHKQTQTISDILVGSEGYIPLGAEFQTKFRYDAPEIIQYDVYSTKSDVFAFGVLMYETLTTKSCKLFSLSKQRVDLLHQHVPTNLISLFEACCNQEPKLRPSSTSMLESIGEWLTNPSIIEVRNCPIDLPGTFQWKTEGYLDCSNEFVDRRKTFCLLRACQIRSESYWWQWQRDCQIIPRLSHDHLVPVLDTFQLVDSEGSRYMAALTLPSISLVNFVATKVQDQPVLIEHAVIVDTVLALEYLAAQQLHPRIVEIEHCRIFEDCLKLQGLVFCDKNDVRTDHHLLTKYFEFLESCNEEFHELQSRNFHHTIQTLSQRILEARGCLAEQGQLLSIAAVHAQDTCNLGNARWNISWDDLCFVKPLGNGAFGEVVLMTLRSAFSSPNSRSGQSVRRMSSNFSTMRSQDHYVAVKTLLDKTARADFDNEMSLMRRLRHPNLISLLHVVDSPESPALVMEYLSGGSLDVWLVGAGKDICSESRLHLAYQVLCGLQELHRLQIVHRDLAARNILVSLDGNIAKVGIGFSA